MDAGIHRGGDGLAPPAQERAAVLDAAIQLRRGGRTARAEVAATVYSERSHCLGGAAVRSGRGLDAGAESAADLSRDVGVGAVSVGVSTGGAVGGAGVDAGLVFA